MKVAALLLILANFANSVVIKLRDEKVVEDKANLVFSRCDIDLEAEAGLDMTFAEWNKLKNAVLQVNFQEFARELSDSNLQIYARLFGIAQCKEMTDGILDRLISIPHNIALLQAPWFRVNYDKYMCKNFPLISTFATAIQGDESAIIDYYSNCISHMKNPFRGAYGFKWLAKQKLADTLVSLVDLYFEYEFQTSRFLFTNWNSLMKVVIKEDIKPVMEQILQKFQLGLVSGLKMKSLIKYAVKQGCLSFFQAAYEVCKLQLAAANVIELGIWPIFYSVHYNRFDLFYKLMDYATSHSVKFQVASGERVNIFLEIAKQNNVPAARLITALLQIKSNVLQINENLLQYAIDYSIDHQMLKIVFEFRRALSVLRNPDLYCYQDAVPTICYSNFINGFQDSQCVYNDKCMVQEVPTEDFAKCIK